MFLPVTCTRFIGLFRYSLNAHRLLHRSRLHAFGVDPGTAPWVVLFIRLQSLRPSPILRQHFLWHVIHFGLPSSFLQKLPEDRRDPALLAEMRTHIHLDQIVLQSLLLLVIVDLVTRICAPARRKKVISPPPGY